MARLGLHFWITRAVAQFGSAFDWGSKGRGFKSRQPDSSLRSPRPKRLGFRRSGVGLGAAAVLRRCVLTLRVSPRVSRRPWGGRQILSGDFSLPSGRPKRLRNFPRSVLADADDGVAVVTEQSLPAAEP